MVGTRWPGNKYNSDEESQDWDKVVEDSKKKGYSKVKTKPTHLKRMLNKLAPKYISKEKH